MEKTFDHQLYEIASGYPKWLEVEISNFVVLQAKALTDFIDDGKELMAKAIEGKMEFYFAIEYPTHLAENDEKICKQIIEYLYKELSLPRCFECNYKGIIIREINHKPRKI